MTYGITPSGQTRSGLEVAALFLRWEPCLFWLIWLVDAADKQDKDMRIPLFSGLSKTGGCPKIHSNIYTLREGFPHFKDGGRLLLTRQCYVTMEIMRSSKPSDYDNTQIM